MWTISLAEITHFSFHGKHVSNKYVLTYFTKYIWVTKSGELAADRTTLSERLQGLLNCPKLYFCNLSVLLYTTD